MGLTSKRLSPSLLITEIASELFFVFFSLLILYYYCFEEFLVSLAVIQSFTIGFIFKCVFQPDDVQSEETLEQREYLAKLYLYLVPS